MSVRCVLSGHDWGEWEYSRPATQWGLPVKVDLRFCSRCRGQQTIVLSPRPHPTQQRRKGASDG
jgi:hypothetical protein